MPRSKLAVLYGALGLMAGSFAFSDEPQLADPHSQHGASPSAQTQPPAEPAPSGDNDASPAPAPPAPPHHPMPNLPYPQMAAMMQMDDRERTGTLLFDQL